MSAWPLHKFAHIQTDKGLRRVKHILRQPLHKLRLTHAGGANEDEGDGLPCLSAERTKLLSAESGDQNYEQLAQIKSREIQLQEELSKLEAMSAPPLTMS
mgnify:CR=1 FL=1